MPLHPIMKPVFVNKSYGLSSDPGNGNTSMYKCGLAPVVTIQFSDPQNVHQWFDNEAIPVVEELVSYDEERDKSKWLFNK